ncbi:MAG: GHMP kinase [Thermoplasmata archaeon]|nr:MAG: GHMP kinase [Thermoplasmata archaeon]
MIIRSKAPLRISFAGGGTDVPPYPEERGGAVLSTTVNKYAFATLIPREDDAINVESLDYDIVAKYHTDEQLPFDGKLDLVKAVINNMKTQQGLDLFMHSDAPPGSGLGSSSTVVVTLVGLFQKWLNLPLTDYDIAELAYKIERIDMGIKGGKQDQYAATFGGFNYIEFHRDSTIVNPLRVKRNILNELEYRLLLCYTGRTRLSAKILDEQVEKYVKKEKTSVEALDELKAICIDMKNALLRGRLEEFGELLHAGWMNKRKLASKISSPEIDKLYETARSNGAIGGKLLGAGGGGYLLLFCEFDKKHHVAEKLENIGGQIVNFGFDFKGLQTWSAE